MRSWPGRPTTCRTVTCSGQGSPGRPGGRRRRSCQSRLGRRTWGTAGPLGARGRGWEETTLPTPSPAALRGGPSIHNDFWGSQAAGLSPLPPREPPQRGNSWIESWQSRRALLRGSAEENLAGFLEKGALQLLFFVCVCGGGGVCLGAHPGVLRGSSGSELGARSSLRAGAVGGIRSGEARTLTCVEGHGAAPGSRSPLGVSPNLRPIRPPRLQANKTDAGLRRPHGALCEKK